MGKQVAVGAGGSLEGVGPRRGSEGLCVWGGGVLRNFKKKISVS